MPRLIEKYSHRDGCQNKVSCYRLAIIAGLGYLNRHKKNNETANDLYVDTASTTMSGMETMRMIQKDQVKYFDKNDIISQNKLINKLFGPVA